MLGQYTTSVSARALPEQCGIWFRGKKHVVIMYVFLLSCQKCCVGSLALRKALNYTAVDVTSRVPFPGMSQMLIASNQKNVRDKQMLQYGLKLNPCRAKFRSASEGNDAKTAICSQVDPSMAQCFIGRSDVPVVWLSKRCLSRLGSRERTPVTLAVRTFG